jgi:peptidoglycan/LPS O-acetylase OafA/YrhL
MSRLTIRRPSGLSYVPELDGLRAVACLGVLIAHYNPVIAHQSLVLQLVRDSSSGNIGVMLFFTLSGYLITGLALRQWHNRLNFDFARFILRRALRIWPIYYVYIALAVVALSGWPGWFFSPLIDVSISWPPIAGALPFYLTFTGNWIDQPIGEFGILWTVCVEMQFYVLFWIVFNSMPLLPQLRTVVIPLSIILAFILRYAIPLFFSLPVQIYYLTFTYIDTFALGAAAAVISGGLIKTPPPLERIMHWPGTGFAAVVALALLGNIGAPLWWPPYALGSAIYYGAISLCNAVLVLCIILNSGSPKLIFLRCTAMRSLGVLSYGAYLFHDLCGRWLNGWQGSAGLTNVDNTAAYYLGFLGYAGGAFALAAIGFVVIERPALSLRSILFDGRSSSTDKRWVVAWRGVLAAGLCLVGLTALHLQLRISP